MTDAGRRSFTIYSDLDNDPFPEPDHDLYTAHNWTLHVRCEPGQEQAMLTRFAASGSEILTGEFVGGDSFAEWCEVYTDDTWYRDHGTALHLYFTAPDAEAARRRARALCDRAGVSADEDAACSTAGDWAVQLDINDDERTRV